MSKNPYATYAANSINTASREELVLMLYEGSIKYLNQSIIALERNDYLKTNEHVKRVQDIVRELQSTLNYDYAVSKDFFDLYDYINRKLVSGNITKNIDDFNEALLLLRDFRDMWKDAMHKAKTEK